MQISGSFRRLPLATPPGDHRSTITASIPTTKVEETKAEVATQSQILQDRNDEGPGDTRVNRIVLGGDQNKLDIQPYEHSWLFLMPSAVFKLVTTKGQLLMNPVDRQAGLPPTTLNMV